MNIEFKFLQKAIEDKNYISFSYEDKKYEHIQPLNLSEKNSLYILETCNQVFEFVKIKKLKILKNRF